MYKGEFKTAYLQREIVEDVAVIGASALKVGQLVTKTAAAGNNPAYITAAAGANANAVLAAATHIVAQSDMTIGYGHVPVENRDYRYSDEVKVSAAAIGADVDVKHVALFKITNKDDIIVREV